MDPKEQLKREIVAEIHQANLRWLRNAAALVGIALAVGCTFGWNPLAGGIVAGVMLAGLSLTAMVLSRRAGKDEEPKQ